VTNDPKNGRYIINHFSGTTPTENGQYQPPPGPGWQHANVNGTNVYFHCG